MARSQKTKRRKTSRPKQAQRAPFLEHLYELRRRLAWVALVVAIFTGVGFAIQESLISLLLKPAADQQFIYTSPGGGINFIIQVCFLFGFIVGIPMIIYNILRYLEPLLRREDRSFIIKCTFFSAILAIGGISFGYFIGLPPSLRFLTSQFHGQQISALLSVSDYLSFVTLYIGGAAVMFQIPVILLFINRITPLSPRKLLASQRWVILLAFGASALITPPDAISLLIMAGPIILVYQIGVIIVWLQNKYSIRLKVMQLSESDKQLQREREERAAASAPLLSSRKDSGTPPAAPRQYPPGHKAARVFPRKPLDAPPRKVIQ